MECLRLIYTFLHLKFRLESVNEEAEGEDALQLGAGKVKVTCLGSGFSNLSKTVA